MTKLENIPFVWTKYRFLHIVRIIIYLFLELYRVKAANME